jgi:TP901-1 family phage major tail protein
MGAQRGKDLLLKIGTGDGAFVTVAGLRARGIALNADTVDVTHAESAGRWRELLEGAGVKRAAVSGAGVFRDMQSDTMVREVFFAGAVRPWQIVVPDFGTISGPFQIANLEYRGDHSGEVTFDMALESAGAVAFAAL